MEKNTNISKIRKELGYTQEKVAEKLNIAKNTLSQWENGKRKPDYEILIKLADFFNCSIDYLIGRKKIDEEKKEPEQVEHIYIEKINQIKNFSTTKLNCLEMINEMSEEQSKLLQSYMQGLLGKEFNYFKN